MNINELIKIIKKKIRDNIELENIDVEDKSFLHKNHKNNVQGKFHILLSIESKELKKKSKIHSTRFIYKILDYELEKYINSLQIKLI